MRNKINPVSTRRKAIYWIIGWKILDVVSTIWSARFYGSLMTDFEINVLHRLFTSYIGFETVILATLPIAVYFCWFTYRSYPLLTEFLALFLPMIVIGNFALLHDVIYNLYISFAYTVLAVLYLVVAEYLHRFKGCDGMSPLIFDTEFTSARL